MKRLSLVALAILALVVVVAASGNWRLAAPAANNAEPADQLSGTFSLIDQDGKQRTERDFRGKYMLVFFGYTYCPDICPTALAVEAQALDKLGERANRIVPIFITVDPRRDTPDRLKSYVSAFDAKPPSPRLNFVGLTGNDEDIADAAEAYRVIYHAHLDGDTPDGSDYSVDHTSDTYLMSPEGKFISYYSIGILPDDLAADLMRKVS